MRVKGILSYDIFEDESFPEFSTNDFAAKLEIERKLRRNTFLTMGYEAHDLEFDTSSFDNYNQQDLYLSFYRFSPEKIHINTIVQHLVDINQVCSKSLCLRIALLIICLSWVYLIP